MATKESNVNSSDCKKSHDVSRRSEKVMVPFFEGDFDPFPKGSDFDLPDKVSNFHLRRSRNKSESYLPRNKSYNFKNSTSTKEIGVDPEMNKPVKDSNFRKSYPSFKGKKVPYDNRESHGNRVVYINKSNVGNIRPLDELYDKKLGDEGIKFGSTILHDYTDLRPDFSYNFGLSAERDSNFVDSLIKSSNKIDEFPPDLQTNTGKSTKSQELKSVLTKMGILDKSNFDTYKEFSDDLTRDDEVLEEVDLKELEKDMEKHYVFPKYMSSPDPSSIPIPGSL